MLPHPLTNIEIQKYCHNEPTLISAYSRNDLPKIKDGVYIIIPDKYKSIWTHWITLYVNGDGVTYFDSFGIENIPKEVKKFIGNKNLIIDIYRIEANDSIVCKYFCVGFIDFMLKGKSLLDYTSLCSPNEYKRNDKMFLIARKLKMKKIYFVICGKYRKFKNLKTYTYIYLEKHQLFLSFAVSEREWRWKNILKRRINWHIKKSLFN